MRARYFYALVIAFFASLIAACEFAPKMVSEPQGEEMGWTCEDELHTDFGTLIPLYTRGYFVGTAFVLYHEHGHTYCLTAYHCIDDNDGEVSFFGSTEIVRYDADVDIAVIRIHGIHGQPFHLSDREPRNGEPATLVSLFDGKTVIIPGHIVNVEEGWYTCDVEHGMSGGALLDSHGRVIGVVTHMYSGLSGAVSTADLWHFITEE